MSRKRAVVFAVTFAAVFVALWALPVWLSGGSLAPFCGNAVGAQDNPCAAQEATIVALEATIADLRGEPILPTPVPTIEVAPVASSIDVTPVPPPVAGTDVFSDSFDNNDSGWFLVPDDNTGATISGGQLVMAANAGWFRWAAAPQLSVTNFYIQAQVATPNVGSALVGFIVGNGQTGQFHFFTIGEDGPSAAAQWFVKIFEWNGAELLEVDRLDLGIDPLWESNQAVTVGLAGQAGAYTLYLNGTAMHSAQVAVYGNQVGLAFYATTRGPSTSVSASFDNLTVSQ